MPKPTHPSPCFLLTSFPPRALPDPGKKPLAPPAFSSSPAAEFDWSPYSRHRALAGSSESLHHHQNPPSSLSGPTGIRAIALPRHPTPPATPHASAPEALHSPSQCQTKLL